MLKQIIFENFTDILVSLIDMKGKLLLLNCKKDDMSPEYKSYIGDRQVFIKCIEIDFGNIKTSSYAGDIYELIIFDDDGGVARENKNIPHTRIKDLTLFNCYIKQDTWDDPDIVETIKCDSVKINLLDNGNLKIEYNNITHHEKKEKDDDDF